MLTRSKLPLIPLVMMKVLQVWFMNGELEITEEGKEIEKGIKKEGRKKKFREEEERELERKES